MPFSKRIPRAERDRRLVVQLPPVVEAASRSMVCPLVKPPYGVLSAVNLDRGDLVWQVPRGDTPDAVRNHPALKDSTFPRPVSKAASDSW